MKASVIYNADATMTLLCNGEAIEFDTVSRMVNYCNDNCIVASKIYTIEEP